MRNQAVSVSAELLCGKMDSQLIPLPDSAFQLHHQVVPAFLKLRGSALAAGFCIQVASSYRSFERQLFIWNAKATGQRAVLDSHGQPLDLAALTDLEKVHAILRWSALPGASRHHWGTDLDVYDSSSIDAEYSLQLTQDECTGAGPFAAFHRWLSEAIARGDSFGFYRPYAEYRGGVAPELWHLSYAPLAKSYAYLRTEAVLRQQLEGCDIALKQCILTHLPELYQRYVCLPE